MRPAGTTTAYTRARKNMCARLEAALRGLHALHMHSAKTWIVSSRKHRPQNNGQRNGQRYRGGKKYEDGLCQYHSFLKMLFFHSGILMENLVGPARRIQRIAAPWSSHMGVQTSP